MIKGNEKLKFLRNEINAKAITSESYIWRQVQYINQAIESINEQKKWREEAVRQLFKEFMENVHVGETIYYYSTKNCKDKYGEGYHEETDILFGTVIEILEREIKVERVYTDYGHTRSRTETVKIEDLMLDNVPDEIEIKDETSYY